MNLDETIKYYENLAETNKNNIVPKEDYQNMPWIDESNEHYKKLAQRYGQLAEWLKGLKAYKNMWDKVIDELEKKFKEYNNVITDLDYATGVGYALEVIKEQKKEIEE